MMSSWFLLNKNKSFSLLYILLNNPYLCLNFISVLKRFQSFIYFLAFYSSVLTSEFWKSFLWIIFEASWQYKIHSFIFNSFSDNVHLNYVEMGYFELFVLNFTVR